jgi:hypothetical protein
MEMETLRNVRSIGAAIVNSELAYAFLMGMGWFFLVGWLVALAVAYAKAFQGDQPLQWAVVPNRTAKKSGAGFAPGIPAKR